METNRPAFKVLAPQRVFEAWAPKSVYWSQWAKPAMFTNTHGIAPMSVLSNDRRVPDEIKNMLDRQTAVIVDLPGKESALKGLGLVFTTPNFWPVPLYKSTHETNIGELTPALDNTELVAALLNGSEMLKKLWSTAESPNIPPAFLLDYNRNQPCDESPQLYDNRWEIHLSDVPSAQYLIEYGIDRVLLWSHGNIINADLQPILDMYRDSELEVLVHCAGVFHEHTQTAFQPLPPQRVHRRGFFTRRLRLHKLRSNMRFSPSKPAANGTAKTSPSAYKAKNVGYKGYGGYGGGGSGGYSGKGYSGGYRGGYGGGYGG